MPPHPTVTLRPIDLADEDWESLAERTRHLVNDAISNSQSTFHALPWGLTKLPANGSRDAVIERAVRATRAWMKYLTKTFGRQVVRNNLKCLGHGGHKLVFLGLLVINGHEVHTRNRRSPARHPATTADSR